MTIKKIIGCILAAAVLVIGSVSAVYADCWWDDDNYGIRAEWDSTDSKIKLQLYKGSSFKVGGRISMASGKTSHDFTGLIKNTGPGSYKFTVTDEAGRTYESELYQADEGIIEQLRTNRWYYENGSWFLKNNKGEILKGWQFVDDKWYCLDIETGACLIDTITSDGYRVDETGAWDGLPSK